jgi:DNA-binding protein HU-beta
MPKRGLVAQVAWELWRQEHKPVHKRQLVAEVARRTSLTQAQVDEALDGILAVIGEKMAAGDYVTLAGFGRFEAREHRPRAVHGLDGNTYQVESRLVPAFHPYPTLRQQVAASQKAEGENSCPKQKASTTNG